MLALMTKMKIGQKKISVARRTHAGARSDARQTTAPTILTESLQRAPQLTTLGSPVSYVPDSWVLNVTLAKHKKQERKL